MSDPTRAYVYIVDDDPACRDSLQLLLELKGYTGVPCASAEEFFDKVHPTIPGCLLLDFRMPDMNGLDVQADIARRGMTLPIIMLSAHGDVATTRNALKAGALDFIEKPVDADQLMVAVAQAVARDIAQRERTARDEDRARRLARLTQREAEVMRLVVAGLQNREIGQRLGISPRTVEVYKARLMLKLETARMPDLIRHFGAAFGPDEQDQQTA